MLSYPHMFKFLAQTKNFLLDLLFPKFCLGCGQEGEFFCLNCSARLRFIPPACFVCQKLAPAEKKITSGRTCDSCRGKSFIYAYFSPFRYSDEPTRSLVHALKYQRIAALHQTLARLLASYARYFKLVFPAEALLIPIPLYPAKERVRGFNQSALIAKQFAALLQEQGCRLECRTEILRRRKNTAPQAELSGAERRKNVINAFAVTKPELISQKTIILLDDVKTTGTTLEEAARVLKEAGAKQIWAITVAH